jgi:trehalose-6-phosphate synthase
MDKGRDVKTLNEIRAFLNNCGIWQYSTTTIKFCSFYETKKVETDYILNVFDDLVTKINQEKPLTNEAKGFII